MASFLSGRKTTFHFRWLGSDSLPNAFDLRAFGWHLDRGGEPSAHCIGVLHAGDFDAECWRNLLEVREEIRRFILVIGVQTSSQRAYLLQLGFGEAVTDTIDPHEFEARACNLAQLTRWLPRHRLMGDLSLDLLAREAYSCGKPLNLNPREFALLWRLADTPGEPVSKQDLIQDVWRMGFVPETNSIAVHMSRLRRKLGFGGMTGIILTASEGGYCLMAPDEDEALQAEPAFLQEVGNAAADRRKEA